jgi:hypothetical protein
MPLGPQPDRSHDESSDLDGRSMPQRAPDLGEMCLTADFCNYRDHIGAQHKVRHGSSAWKVLQSAIRRAGSLFDVPDTTSSGVRGEAERFSTFCATGGITGDGRQVVALVEGITPSATKFGVPAGSLKYPALSPESPIFSVEMPQMEVFDEAAGVVVSVDCSIQKGFSLALILTREAFEQALFRLMKVSEFLESKHKENPHALTNFLPLASSIFALLFNEARTHESPILGVKRLVGPSRNFVFELSVLSMGEEGRSSALISTEGVREMTHHIAVRHNEFGIVESHWLGRQAVA